MASLYGMRGNGLQLANQRIFRRFNHDGFNFLEDFFLSDERHFQIEPGKTHQVNGH